MTADDIMQAKIVGYILIVLLLGMGLASWADAWRFQ